MVICLFLPICLLRLLFVQIVGLAQDFLTIQKGLPLHHLVVMLLKSVLKTGASDSQLILYLVEVESVFTDVVGGIYWVNQLQT